MRYTFLVLVFVVPLSFHSTEFFILKRKAGSRRNGFKNLGPPMDTNVYRRRRFKALLKATTRIHSSVASTRFDPFDAASWTNGLRCSVTSIGMMCKPQTIYILIRHIRDAFKGVTLARISPALRSQQGKSQTHHHSPYLTLRHLMA